MSALDDLLQYAVMPVIENGRIVDYSEDHKVIADSRAELSELRASAASEKAIISLLDKACQECRIDVTGLTASEKIDRLVDKIDEW